MDPTSIMLVMYAYLNHHVANKDDECNRECNDEALVDHLGVDHPRTLAPLHLLLQRVDLLTIVDFLSNCRSSQNIHKNNQTTLTRF